MTSYRLDDLAHALRSSLEGSQKKIDQKQAKRLSQVINVDKLGQPESLSWECRIPSGDGSERNFEMLRLPWASLKQTEMLSISNLSIELDCKIKKNSRRLKEKQTPVTATPINRGNSAGEKTHRVKLNINNQHQETSVSVDGVTVEDFLEEQLSPEQKQKELKNEKRNYLIAIIISSLFFLLAAMAYVFFIPN